MKFLEKLTLSNQFTMMLIAMVFFTSASVGYLTYYRLDALLLKEKLETLREISFSGSISFKTEVREMSDDVLFLAGVPPISGMMRTQRNAIDPLDGSTNAQWTARLTNIFERLMKANPEYLQVRLIGVENNGREIVRVDRQNGAPRVIPFEKLQEKGRTTYFSEAIQYEPDEVYISNIELNRENGQISMPHTPVIRAAMPIYQSDGKVFGLIVINASMKYLFDLLTRDIDGNHQLYIVSKDWDFLLHPNPTKSFAFEQGAPYRLTDEWPMMRNDLDRISAQESVSLDVVTDQKLAFGTYKVSYSSHPEDHYLIFLTSAPYQQVIADALTERRQLLEVVFLILLLALLAAYYIARQISRPLHQLTQSANLVSQGDFDTEIAVTSNNEVGVLADAFRHMIENLKKQIDQRQRTEDQLRDSNEQVRAIVESVVDAIITIDDKGIIQTFNPAATLIFGYAADEVIGHNVRLLMPEPDRGKHDQYINNYLQTGDAKIIGRGREVVGKRKDGSLFPMELAISEMSIQGQRGFTGIVREISERKRIEYELTTARDLAEAANLAKSQFLATMSHELRTPLNAIIGYSEILVEDAEKESDEQTISDLKNILGPSKHLLGLINDILDLSKIDAGKTEVYPDTFSVKDLVDDVIGALQQLVKKNSNQLTVKFDESLDGMYSDSQKVRQILFNLLSNACKFTRNGEIELRVTKLGSGAAETVEFAVQDNGIGIEEDQMALLFQPFSQVDSSATREFGGSGLGLVISARLSELLGGEIKVESSVGEGSTFTLTLPLQVPTSA